VVEPSLSYWALRKRAYLHIYHFASVLMDRVYQSFFTETKFAMESDGFQNITTAFEKKSGLVIVGAHLGAWDIALRYLKDHGFEGDFFSVQFESQKAHFNQVKSANEGKQVSRIKSESSDDFVLQIHKAVRGGLPVALMGDRPPPTSCELVRFFGKLIPLDTTPFRIAAAARVPLVFSFGIKSRPGVYSFSCTKARVLNYEDEIPRSILLKKWVQEYADVLESLLKKNPASWFNFYPVFSSIPDFGPLERPGEAPKRQIRIELREELQSSKTLEVRSLSASSNQGVDSRPT
jgi:predicted LPLAT superfamily acyltransferase